MISTFQRLASLLTPRTHDQDSHVHFHQGPQGQPAACHDGTCAAPRLSV